jgi:hypothetical protein
LDRQDELRIKISVNQILFNDRQVYWVLAARPGKGMVGLLGRRDLTSSAERVFLANIQMKVFNTDSAVLDVDLLLLAITMVFELALALV